MKPDPAAVYFPYYFGVWALLGLVSYGLINSQPTAQEKKKWSDRLSVIMGIFVVGFACFVMILWKQYAGIPIAIAAGIGIGYLTLHCTFYCDSCGKRSQSQNWFSPQSEFHCPHCGHKLK